MMHNMVTKFTGQDEMEEKMKMMQEMKGMEFDMQFLSTMQMHHKQAIEMSELALKNAESNDLKKMAKEMIVKQEKEIKEMEEMKKKMK